MHETTEVAYEVGQLTRVEGEGSLSLTVRGGEVTEARLRIFEAPRYFERLVVGRTPDEVIDIVARICGICPVAYQMSAVHAFERLFGVEIDPDVRRLRRLFYCGEWIESHALHIHLLHAPDFLGYPSAIELAGDHPAIVERGLRMKKLGNRIVALIGGRAIHPVSVRVGGISRAPDVRDLEEIRRELPGAIADAQETVRWTATLEPPPYVRRPRLVSLRDPDEYPMNEGRIVSSDGLDLDAADWPTAFEERQVPWSNALQAVGRDGAPYLLGPTARVALAGPELHPLAAEALRETGLGDELVTNVFRSIVARSVELLHAFAEAADILADPPRPRDPLVAWTARPGIAAWATEAPRGLLFHRYEVGADDLIDHATIVPPTSQNQAAIEHDLRSFAPSVLDLPHAEATHRLEQLIRSYDPCISCATHFLDLRVGGIDRCA
jgi:coenzyme F420-reducing hydrogenase alpha subunit